MKLGLFTGSVREVLLAQAGLRCPVAAKRSKVWRIDSSTNEYRLCYCEDPFGNLSKFIPTITKLYAEV
jgi:hypothetical protein